MKRKVGCFDGSERVFIEWTTRRNLAEADKAMG